MNCENAINQSLATLAGPFEKVQDFLAADAACIAHLVSLSDECSATMAQMARELLQRAREEDNEFKFQTLLRALFQRSQPEALDLAIEALASPDADDKEAYVRPLVELEEPRVFSALIDFVTSAPSTDSDEETENEGWALVEAIDWLRYHRVGRAAPSVLLRLNEYAYRVRRAAIDFVVSLDLQDAAPRLVQQLDREDDPDNLKALLDGLLKWNYVAALPRLRSALNSEPAKGNELLEKPLRSAIALLESSVR